MLEGKSVTRREWQRCDELTAAPIPHLCTACSEKVESFGVKLSPGRREGVGKRFFQVWFQFSLSFPDFNWQQIKIISLSCSCFTCDSNWWVISPCPYLNPCSFHHIFLSLFSQGMEWQSDLVGTTAYSSYKKPRFSVTWICVSMCLPFVFPGTAGNSNRMHRDWGCNIHYFLGKSIIFN